MRLWMIGAITRGRATALLFILALLAGCGDHHSVTGLDLPESPELSAFATLSAEGPLSDEPGGFHWLPPMAPDPAITGRFDAELTPRVRICEWNGECAVVVAEFSGEGSPASTTVRVDEVDEHYIVNWHTERFDLDTQLPYRIQVLVDGPETGTEWVLGYADIRVVASARDLRNVDQAYLGVLRGRTLPIRFRVETGIAGSVTVEPREATVPVGGRQLFTATVRDIHGRPISGAPVVWSSADPAVAEIDEGGWATGKDQGEVVITASSGRVSGTATLTVEAAAECPDCTLVPGMDPVMVQAEPGETEVVTFFGVADQRISILVEHLAGFCATYTILDPTGEEVVLAPRCGGWFTDLLVLEATGEYRIEIVHTFGPGIDARITIWEVPLDAWAETTIDGDPGVVVIEAPAQNAFVTFEGQADDRVSLRVLQTYGCGGYELRAPSGEVLWGPFSCGNPFSDLLILPETGTWTLFIDPNGSGFGEATVWVRTVPFDATAETTIDGDPGVVVIEAPAQNAFVTFEGQAGDPVTLQILQTFGCAGYELRAPSGEVLWGPFSCGNPFSGPLTLTESGTWTLFIDPNLDGVGDAEVYVRSILLDAEAETSIDGDPAVVVIDTPGQNAFVTFDGAVGDSITVQVIRTFGCTDFQLRAPSGAALWTRFDCANPFSGLLVLPETGTWTLVIDPRGSTVGQGTVYVRSVPPDAEGVATIGGERVELAITAPAQNARVRFDGPAGQQVLIHSDRVSGACARYTLSGPTAEVIGGLNGVFRCGALSETVTLPDPGTYMLLIDPNGPWTGLTRTTVSEP